jgi:methionyl-tRNA formyltransferase
METESLRIVYMGTPVFAVAPLEKLLGAGCNVVAVITAPDRPAGRGKQIRRSAVKEFALARGLTLLQPDNLKEPGFIAQLRGLAPDLQVVVAFRMLPELVWRIPTLGTFNLHASLLPDYRGAAPINHVIINGESRTGVSTFLIDARIDTGNILLQEETGIGEAESAGELHDRLMVMGAGLVLETTRRLASGSLKARSQDELISPGMVLHSAPKIRKEDCRIDWNRPGMELFNLIRGLSPSPGAFTHLVSEAEKPVICKIFRSGFEPENHRHPPGSIITDDKKYLKAAVKDGFLDIYAVQLEGKRRMEIGDFLMGFNLTSFQSRFS